MRSNVGAHTLHQPERIPEVMHALFDLHAKRKIEPVVWRSYLLDELRAALDAVPRQRRVVGGHGRGAHRRRRAHGATTPAHRRPPSLERRSGPLNAFGANLEGRPTPGGGQMEDPHDDVPTADPGPGHPGAD